MSLLTHLSTLVDALSRRLPLRPALCSGRGSEQHFLCTPGWHTVALLQKPLKTLTASSPTVSLAVVASGGTCYSGPPSLWRTVFAFFGTCHIKFIERSHRQSVTKRHLRMLPTILGHMLPVALGPRRAKVSLSSLFLAL